MGDVWSSEVDKGSWNLVLSRLPNNWETEDAKRFLMSLDGKKVLVDVDKVPWEETKNRNFTIKSMYRGLEVEPFISFPLKMVWRNCAAIDLLLCLGSNLGIGLDLRQHAKESLALANICYLCQESCAKMKILRDLLFTLFEVSWVIPSLIWDTPLGWNWSFIRTKSWKIGPLYIFWSVQKTRNKIAFGDKMLFV